MSIIAKYKFDQTIYENFIPEFNGEFANYTITDEIDTDGFTIRTIESDSLPQRIKFGETAASYVEKGVQSLIEILFVDIRNGMTNFNGFLANAINLISVNTDGWDTSGIVTMQQMFYNCSSLTSLDVSNFNTENVTSMNAMFNNCSSLTSLDVSNFNTEKVTNMDYMFQNCSSLTSLDLSNFNTEKVTNMTSMMYGCSSLTSLDVSNFNTEKVTNMTGMFQDCSSLIHLDISSFNGSALTTGCGSMFFGCVSLQEIIFPKKFITNKCVNISAMFRNCPSLKYVDVSDWDTSSVTTINQTFNGCKSLTSLDLSSWDTTNVTSYYQAFNGCTSLQSLDISNFNILSSVTDTNTHITVCKKLVHVGMLYCNSETINIIANQIGSTKTIWYQDANLSDLTQLDNITYKKYQSTTLSLNEPIQLRSIGDVHDEIDYETGEYIQRIGEVILDGSESWLLNAQLPNTNGYYAFYYCPSDIKLIPEFMDVNSDRFSPTKNNNMINEMNGEFVTIHGWGYGINICIKGDKLVEQNVDGFKQWLSQNPTTVQYQLAQPTTRKIDTTILDQNNSYKSSQQTYDEQTYVSVQSDTVVTPTSSVDYEIYSSTGTVTGTSATIENVEAGTPVSGVIYGETLLNVIQEPSEDEFVCTDNFSGKETTIENSVVGNVKDVIIKGQTLVNLVDFKNNVFGTTGTITSRDGNKISFTTSTTGKFNLGCNLPRLKPSTKYLLKIKAESSLSANVSFYVLDVVTNNYIISITTISDSTLYYFTTGNDVSNIQLGFLRNVTVGDDTVIGEAVVIEYQDGMENWGIPYFEGIGSVTNYRTINNMQPTCTYTENNGTYWCDTTTINPTVGKRYFIKIFNNPNNIITRFFYGGVIVDTTTDYGIVTATDRTGMRLHFYNLNKDTVTITEEQKNAIRFLICEYQDGMENWEINEHFEESYTVQMPILTAIGKNLFDIDTMVTKNATVENGVVTKAGNVSHTLPMLKITNLEVGKTYTLSCDYSYSFTSDGGMLTYCLTYDDGDYSGAKDNIKISTSNITRIEETFEAKKNVVYLIGSIGRTYISNIQVEQGSQPTSFEPHKSTTVTVNENIELNSIGDVYDELNITTGELTQRIGKVVLDGSEDWQIDSDTNDYRLALALKHNGEMLKYTQSICDRYPTKTGKQSDTTYNYVYIGSTSINLYENPSMTLEEFKSKLKQNPMTFQYQFTTESIKTVDLSIVDQDNVQQKYVQTYDTTTHLKPQSYELIPTVEYKNPSYDVLLKANTQYTIKLNRTNIVEGTPLTVNLGGTELSIEDSTDSFTITTPSILTNNILSICGANNKVKQVMIIEGDYVDRDLGFFEGFVHVENPILHITCKNLFNPKNTFKVGYMNWLTGQVTYSDSSYDSVTDFIPIQEIEPGTYYFHYKDETNRIDVCFYDENKKFVHGAVTKATIPNTAKYMRVMVRNIKQTIIPLQMEKGTSKTEYEPYQGNTLTTYPQITLRSIGDIKDEWDVVGETVTKYIGEVVLDGSQDMGSDGTLIYCYLPYSVHNNISRNDKLPSITIDDILDGKIGVNPQNRGNGSRIYININEIATAEEMKNYLTKNPIKLQVCLTTPITESVRITPPNPQTSTASITIPTQLNHVEDTSDFLVWNPYKEHYVRYNYVEDGVVLDNYTWENLTDLDERQFVEFYNRRTYIDQPYHSYVTSHDSKGTSKYVLIEPNQDYTVSVRFSELPTCETVKVNLGGAEVEMNVNDPHVHVTTPNTLVNNLCSISGDGLDGKVTDILVIHCLEHEGFADIDYFEGIDGIGEIVEVDGVPQTKIVIQQTNGNLLDYEPVLFNNGNYISMGWDDKNKSIPIHPNKEYVFKLPKRFDNEWGDYGLRLYDSNFNQTRTISNSSINDWRRFIFTPTIDEKYIRMFAQFSSYGETHCHVPVELCYVNMEKDYIRPRYYDKEEILLPIQLHRINTVYDNFYYDEMKGYYRIQQSIGHKYFVGADSENWTLIERGQRVLRFRYNNADIQMKSLGEFMTNRLPNGTATSPYECCAFNGINFIVSIDKERLSSESLTAFKEWLANNNLHLYYQLASPLMIDLPEYSSRIEFNTYKDEIYTFFKNCKPTAFTLAVPLDQTYRFYELEQGEGYANRVELTDERMTEEDTLYINTIYGSGIGNLIEEPNNVDTMLKPNYEGKATSHSLTNGKVSTIGVHGFEPNNVTISNYNTVTKQYELTVQAQQGTNTNTETLAVPYKLEIYEDGTKDRVYYNSQYKQWMFEGGQTLTVPYNESTGAFASAIEVFRGLQPRSGLIGEFKVKFASGTTSARLYYSINGTTYGYTTLRGMTDEVDYYIGFFNTGGTKIDMGTKIDANAEYTTLVPINGTIPECLMINQIQSITECTYYHDKTYYYSDVVSPLVLDVYNGETIITELNGAVIDIQNNAHNKQALIYGDTTYTVYWTYVGGEGNIKVTLGGTTQEVVATQGYVTITTSDTDLERGLFIGGFNVTIKDLMLVKGERIENLKYFEGSRAVGTAFTDENGEIMYKITLVTGSELINDKFEEIITFEDNKKHNVVVTKLLGAKPDKI